LTVDTETENIKSISVIGLGKLGAPIAACLASAGFEVIGVDVNTETVDAFGRGSAPVEEPGLADLIDANRARIRATVSVHDAIMGSQVTFVVVPTPSTDSGEFSVEHAKIACASIGRALADKDQYHLVVMSSTVLPGSTRDELLPVLESESGKKCGIDFGLCYSPEFIALGTVIRDFLNPDFYLIGEFDRRSGDFLAAVHTRTAAAGASVQRLSLENAELAKISVNSFVTLKISFANMIADFCERIPGGAIDEVTAAIGLDKRIGPAYLAGGLGFGGPCFPRDNVALAALGDKLGVDVGVLRANQDYNSHRTERLLSGIEHALVPGSRIAVLGLAYKLGTSVIEESPGIQLCLGLAARGYQVMGYDPLATGAAEPVLSGAALLTQNLEEAIGYADVIFVASRDALYSGLGPEFFKHESRDIVVIDCWRSVPLWADYPGVNYFAVGKNTVTQIASPAKQA